MSGQKNNWEPIHKKTFSNYIYHCKEQFPLYTEKSINGVPLVVFEVLMNVVREVVKGYRSSLLMYGHVYEQTTF